MDKYSQYISRIKTYTYGFDSGLGSSGSVNHYKQNGPLIKSGGSTAGAMFNQLNSRAHDAGENCSQKICCCCFPGHAKDLWLNYKLTKFIDND